MSDKENYEALKPTYEVKPQEIVKQPNMPIDIAVNEAMDTHYNAKQDSDKLATTDIDISLIEDLPVRAGGLKYAQFLWDQVYKDTSTAEEEWKTLSPIAYDLRDELLHVFRYAYRKDEKLMVLVGRIAEGSGHADLVMDLGSLAMLGKNNPAPLQAVNLDITKLDRASELSEQCNELLGRVHGARTADDQTEKDMRDRAFTHLKQAVDTIREAGKFLFWKDEERVLLYGSRYGSVSIFV
tara:strand:+ start:130 stop:846 length:717 start_codon:yes stop_codon:yes gene_type:complete